MAIIDRIVQITKAASVLVIVSILTACSAERMAWSPDGQKLAVIGSDGLYVSSDGGTHFNGTPVEPDADTVAWFPDSQKLFITTKRDCEGWQDLERNVDAVEVENIKSGASLLIDSMAAHPNNPMACKDELFKSKFKIEYLKQALLYLRANHSEQLRKLLGADWSKYSPSKLSISITAIKIYSLSQNGSLAQDSQLACTTKEFSLARISHSGRFACLKDNDDKLFLLAIQPGGQLETAGNHFASDPEWDRESDTIYAIHIADAAKAEPAKSELVSIDATQPTTLKQLTATATKLQRLRSLTGGRIILGRDFTFAAKPGGKSEKADSLVELNLGTSKLRLLYRANKADQLDTFDLSPSGKYISFSSKDNAVNILTVKDGSVRCVQPGRPKCAQLFAPVWKNEDELCFTKNTADPKKSTVAIYSCGANKVKTISGSWSAEIGGEELESSKVKVPTFSDLFTLLELSEKPEAK